MQETQIILHIRSMYFRSKFIEISVHVSKPKLYYIENQIILQYESLPDFDPKKIAHFQSKRDKMNPFRAYQS